MTVAHHNTIVAIRRAADYTSGLESGIRDLLAPLGGIEAFVRAGQRVLLKPNLLSDRPPEQAVTTHPELVRAVIRLCRGAGATVVVADSPANVMKIERVWERTGLAQVCAETGAELINLERAGAVARAIGEFNLSIARPVAEADVVINLPKLKTHVLTTLTGAVKNLYGAVPGFQKTAWHRDYPDVRRFGRLVAAVAAAVRPALTIMDGIVAHHGDGPSGGAPYPLGLLLAARDPVALDAVVCRLLAIRPGAVPFLAPAEALGLGTLRHETIRIDGPSPESLRPRGFRVPGTWRARLIPAGLVRALRRWIWIRPMFTTACRRCGLCVKACPNQALALAAEASAPGLDPARCIECCCCHEVCPYHAIVMTQSPLLTAARGGRRF